MKKQLFSMAAILLIAILSNNVMAQTSATSNASNNALATIISPITIAAGVDLSFGDIIKGAGDVTVATDGTRTINAAMKSGLQLGTITAATFIVTGEEAYTYDITLPDDSTVKLSLLSADDMAVTNFVSDPDGSSTLTSGDNTIKVGAKLTVAADQLAGDYVGTFQVTVAYN
jgi:hypothetical protein